MSSAIQVSRGAASSTSRSRLLPLAWGRLVAYVAAKAPNRSWTSDFDFSSITMPLVPTYRGSRSYGTVRHVSRVVAGLVPATPVILALCLHVRIGVGSIDWFRSPLPPNRTCGSPASGSPVGGLTREGTDGPRTWRLVQAQRLPLG